MITKKYLQLILFTGLLLFVMLTLPLAAQDESGPPQVGLRPDAPQYALHGPHWVGVYEFTLDADHRENPLEIVAWYPALNPDGADETITYVTNNQYDTEEGYPADVYGHALRDATPDTNAAPYPVILLSPGLSDWPFHIAWLGEHLASHGFVVLALGHREVTIFAETDEEWMDEYARERIALMRRFLDTETLFANLVPLSEAGFLAGTMNMDMVGVTGFSYGGTVALAAGGARLALDEFADRCAALPEDDWRQGGCTVWLGDRERLVEIAGYESEPQGLWPAWSDPRVKAIAPLGPDSYMFGESGLAMIHVPVLTMYGELSGGLEADPRVTYDMESALIVFENAGHFIFEVQCDDIPIFYEWDATFACSDPVWDMLRVHDLINHLETAFFLAELKGDAEARAALAPDMVDFPGVTYEAEGF